MSNYCHGSSLRRAPTQYGIQWIFSHAVADSHPQIHHSTNRPRLSARTNSNCNTTERNNHAGVPRELCNIVQPNTYHLILPDIPPELVGAFTHGASGFRLATAHSITFRPVLATLLKLREVPDSPPCTLSRLRIRVSLHGVAALFRFLRLVSFSPARGGLADAASTGQGSEGTYYGGRRFVCIGLGYGEVCHEDGEG